MRDTNPPSQSGSNKLIIVFLVAGVVVLAAAGAVIFNRRSSNEPPVPPPSTMAASVDVPAPLIAAQPTRQPIVEDQDTASDLEGQEETDQDGKKAAKARRGKVGSIDANVVNSFMNARFVQVKACYERSLKKNSFLEGKVDLNIDVSPTGKVTRVTVNKDTVGDADMLACVKRTIRGWPFPKPEGGRVIIGKTFNFKKKM